jgi:hypothetical protein
MAMFAAMSEESSWRATEPGLHGSCHTLFLIVILRFSNSISSSFYSFSISFTHLRRHPRAAPEVVDRPAIHGEIQVNRDGGGGGGGGGQAGAEEEEQ